MSDQTQASTQPTTATTPQSLIFDDISFKEEPVRVGTKSYILRESTGDGAAKYRSASAQCARLQDGKVSGMQGVGNLEPYLISLCLLERTETASGTVDKYVTESVVRAWPARIVKAIFDKAMEISGLSDKESKEVLEKRLKDTQNKLDEINGVSSTSTKSEDAEGNSSGGMKDGSA